MRLFPAPSSPNYSLFYPRSGVLGQFTPVQCRSPRQGTGGRWCQSAGKKSPSHRFSVLIVFSKLLKHLSRGMKRTQCCTTAVITSDFDRVCWVLSLLTHSSQGRGMVTRRHFTVTHSLRWRGGHNHLHDSGGSPVEAPGDYGCSGYRLMCPVVDVVLQLWIRQEVIVNNSVG